MQLKGKIYLSSGTISLNFYKTEHNPSTIDDKYYKSLK